MSSETVLNADATTPKPIAFGASADTSRPGRTVRPGEPVENAFIESVNGRLRDECLNVYSFESVAHAQRLIRGAATATTTVRMAHSVT